MKKILFVFCFVVCFNFLMQGQTTKSFYIALKAAPTYNWFWGGKSEMMHPHGYVIGFSGGIEIIKSFKNISIQSGVLFETTGGKVKYNNYGRLAMNGPSSNNSIHNLYFYEESENKILNSDNNHYGSNWQSFVDGDKNIKYCQLNDREYKFYYLTIPILLVFNEKLPFHFNGVLGVDYSYLLSARVNDNVTNIDYYPNYYYYALGEIKELKNINISEEIHKDLLKLNLGVSKTKYISKKIYVVYGINYLLGLTKPLIKMSNQLIYEKVDVSALGIYNAKRDHLNQNVNINSLEVNLELVW